MGRTLTESRARVHITETPLTPAAIETNQEAIAKRILTAFNLTYATHAQIGLDDPRHGSGGSLTYASPHDSMSRPPFGLTYLGRFLFLPFEIRLPVEEALYEGAPPAKRHIIYSGPYFSSQDQFSISLKDSKEAVEEIDRALKYSLVDVSDNKIDPNRRHL